MISFFKSMKYILRRAVILTALACCIPFFSHSQQISDEVIQRILKNLHHFDSLLFTNSDVRYARALLNYGKMTADTAMYKEIEDVLALEKKGIRGRTGLDIAASYNYNSNFNAIDDDDFLYRNKLSVGMNWDIMKSSWVGTTPLLQKAELRAQTQKNEASANALELAYRERAEKVDDYFDWVSLQLKQQQRMLLKEILDIHETLYKSGNIEISQLYQHYNNLQTTVDQIKYLESRIKNNSWGFFIRTTSYVDIDLNKLYEQVKRNSPVLLALDNEMEANRLSIKETSFARDVRVAPFVRYQYFDYPGLAKTNRNNIAAGVNVSFPLSFQYKPKREEYKVQINLLERKKETAEAKIISDCATLYHQYIDGLMKLQGHIYSYVQIRMDLLQKRMNSQVKNNRTNNLAILETMSNYFKEVEAFFDSRRTSEQQLLKLQYYAGGVSMTDFGEVKQMNEYITLSPKERAVYLWQAEKRKYYNLTDAELAYVLWRYNFNNYYISYNSKAELGKLNTQTRETERYYIKTHMVISNNELLGRDSAAVMAYLAPLDSVYKMNGIVLDIEPHTLPDWNEHKERYLDQLLNLYRIIDQYTASKKAKLTVNVPHTYPDAFYREAAKYVDRFSVMIYNKSVDKIKALVDSLPLFREIPAVVEKEIVIRPEDFPEDPYRAMDTLAAIEGISGVAVQSIQSLQMFNIYKPQLKQETIAGKTDYYYLIGTFGTHSEAEAVRIRLFPNKSSVIIDKDGFFRVKVSGFSTYKDMVRHLAERARSNA